MAHEVPHLNDKEGFREMCTSLVFGSVAFSLEGVSSGGIGAETCSTHMASLRNEHF